MKGVTIISKKIKQCPKTHPKKIYTKIKGPFFLLVKFVWMGRPRHQKSK